MKTDKHNLIPSKIRRPSDVPKAQCIIKMYDAQKDVCHKRKGYETFWERNKQIERSLFPPTQIMICKEDSTYQIYQQKRIQFNSSMSRVFIILFHFCFQFQNVRLNERNRQEIRTLDELLVSLNDEKIKNSKY